MPTTYVRHYHESAGTPAERIRSMNRDLANIRATLAILERHIAPAVIALSNAVGDGFVTRGDGPSSGISDPVGAAIARADKAITLDSELRLAWTVLVEIPNAVTNHLRRARTLTPGPTPIVSACAAGIHLHGYSSWGRKDGNGAPVRCDEIAEPDRDGLCLKCYGRRYRWRQSEKQNVS